MLQPRQPPVRSAADTIPVSSDRGESGGKERLARSAAGGELRAGQDIQEGGQPPARRLCAATISCFPSGVRGVRAQLIGRAQQNTVRDRRDVQLPAISVIALSQHGHPWPAAGQAARTAA